MANFLDDAISEIYGYVSGSNTALVEMYFAMWDAGVDMRFGTMRDAGVHIQDAASALWDFILASYNWTGSLHRSSYDAFVLIRDNWAEDAAAFDMDAMLAAMLMATPSQIKYFIGLVDAYRVGIWDAPFDADYFASLARLYKQWQ